MGRRLAVGAIVTTATLAFAVAAAAMTLPELVVGQSLGQGDRQTTLFGGGRREAGDTAPTTTDESETETTPTGAAETTTSEAETAPAPQQPEYQPRQSEMPQTAPSAQPTEPRPAQSDTGPGSGVQP